MIFTANDRRPAASGARHEWDMSIFELAIFVGTDRAKTPARADFLSEFLAGWIDCKIAVEDIDRALSNMIDSGWLAVVGDRLMPTEKGRRAAGVLLNGVIGMVDQADAAQRRFANVDRAEARKKGIGSWF